MALETHVASYLQQDATIMHRPDGPFILEKELSYREIVPSFSNLASRRTDRGQPCY